VTDLDLSVDRAGLLRWAQGEARRLSSTLAKAGKCEHCIYYSAGHCQHWHQAIPEEHRATGCDQWRIDLIPF